MGVQVGRLAFSLSLAALASACASPVGVSIESPRVIHRYLTQSALSGNEPSVFSLIELRRYDLLDAYHDDPDAALARLHDYSVGAPAVATQHVLDPLDGDAVTEDLTEERQLAAAKLRA